MNQRFVLQWLRVKIPFCNKQCHVLVSMLTTTMWHYLDEPHYAHITSFNCHVQGSPLVIKEEKMTYKQWQKTYKELEKLAAVKRKATSCSLGKRLNKTITAACYRDGSRKASLVLSTHDRICLKMRLTQIERCCTSHSSVVLSYIIMKCTCFWFLMLISAPLTTR